MAQMSDEVMSEELVQQEQTREQTSAWLSAQLMAQLTARLSTPTMAWHGKTIDEHVSSRWRGQGWLSLRLCEPPPLRG